MQSNQVIISIDIDGVSSRVQVEAQSGGRPAWDKLQCVARAGGSRWLDGVSYCDSAANPQISDAKFQTVSVNDEQ
jgi:hypothetical protein